MNLPAIRFGVFILATAVGGAAVGVAQTLWHSGWLDASRQSRIATFASEGNDDFWTLPADGRRPRIALDREEHDFGVMEFGETMRHAFTVRNTGDFPLILAKADSSCTCTLANIAEDAILPGGEAQVELEWTARATPTSGSRFRHWAKLQTNDPDRPLVTLTVEGDMTPPVAAHPAMLTFTRLAKSQTASATVGLYCYRASTGDGSQGKPFEIVKTELLSSVTAEYFEVSIQATPPPDLEKRHAKSGATFTVAIRPGLPIGAFRQVIRVHTNVDGVDPVDVVVAGEVGEDIRLVGAGYNERSGVLDLGAFNAAKGISRELELFIYGKRDVDLPVAIDGSAMPWLQVTADKATFDVAKQVLRARLKVNIPPGSVVPGGENSNTNGRFLIHAGKGIPPLAVQLRFKAQ